MRCLRFNEYRNGFSFSSFGDALITLISEALTLIIFLFLVFKTGVNFVIISQRKI